MGTIKADTIEAGGGYGSTGVTLEADGQIKSDGALTVAPDTDTAGTIGRAKFSTDSSDQMTLSHVDQTGAANAALRQSAAGFTVVNAPSGASVTVRINNVAQVTYDGTTATFASRLLVRSVTDAGPMTNTAGTQREIVFNTSDSKFYGCTATGTPAMWAAFH